MKKLLFLLLLISNITFAQQSLAEITGEKYSLYNAICSAKQDTLTKSEYKKEAKKIAKYAGLKYDGSVGVNLALLNFSFFYVREETIYYNPNLVFKGE